MFKTAATKLAHNSTLPALSGNVELRPLQDLITAEKTVLISLQKLSVDFSKASEALRTWGLSEGDDLGDILSASTTVLNHFSSALSQYAAHGHVMRENLKAIRTREENLEELKRRRRVVLKRADDAERKLSKMSPEHKNLQMQTETLNRLRDEIRTMDSDLMVEEAALGDFKRTACRMWMGLKFGGLLECCEKGTIASEYGKMLISEISEEQTQPGLPRPFYQGQSQTEALVAETHRRINEVTLSTVPSVGFRDRRSYQGDNGDREGNYGIQPWSDSKPMPPPPRDSSDIPAPPRPFASDMPSSPASSVNRPYPWSSSTTEQAPYPGDQKTVDDFGVNAHTGGYDKDGSGGRFATFPVKGRPPGAGPPAFQDSLSLSSRHELGPSFASSIADAFDPDGPLSPHGSSLPRPPPGAALPGERANPWADATGDSSRQQRVPLTDNDDALLAYMTSADDDEPDSPEKTSTFRERPKGAGAPTLDDDKDEKHVRFGEVSDVAEEMEKRVSLEKEQSRSARSSTDKSNAFPSALAGNSSSPTSKSSPEDQEKALNAAAAREISLEMEALNANAPEPERRPSMDNVERGRRPSGASLGAGSYQDSRRDPSPLAPPSAPFAQRSVSPHPYMDSNQTTPTFGNPYAPTPSHGPSSYGASNPYGGSPATSPSQPSYFESNQTPTSNPPRLQSLNQGQESQVPPRFQPSPKPAIQIPPRFQGSAASPLASPLAEYRSLAASRSNASINSSVSGTMTPPPPGARTISAAAFKKPRGMSSDNVGSKGLPGSPYPTSRVASATGGPPAAQSQSHPLPPPPPGAAVEPLPETYRVSQAGSDFDYVDAYMNPSAPSTPNKAEFGSSANPPVHGGYGSGKFSTDLDGGNGLR